MSWSEHTYPPKAAELGYCQARLLRICGDRKCRGLGGAAICSTIGMGMIVILLALGDIILGMFVLFTRRKKIIETED